jgi:Lipopolysaccharide kinase (Kdo/WaaP) family
MRTAGQGLRRRKGLANLPVAVQRSNKGADASPAASAASQAEAVAAGSLGFTVRCTPRRRTVLVGEGDAAWFAKLRSGGPRAARTEWHWLHRLRELGFRVPDALVLRCGRGQSLVGTARVRGRPLDALLVAAFADGEVRAACAFACEVVAPMVARLHGQGLCFRDLYWNHLFAEGLDPAHGEPVLIDVERTFAPRFRVRRWRIKDLAGLLASLPVAVQRTDALRFLKICLGGLPADWKPFARRISGKAARIRAHRPRYG